MNKFEDVYANASCHWEFIGLKSGLLEHQQKNFAKHYDNDDNGNGMAIENILPKIERKYI